MGKRSDGDYDKSALEVLKTMAPPKLRPDAHIGDTPTTPPPTKKPTKPKPTNKG